MDSKSSPIITQSDDGCINQHHEMECTDFNILQVNTINTSNPSQNTSYKSLHEPNTETSNKNAKKNDQEKEAPTTALNEIKIMIKLAIPVSLTSIARVVMWNTDQIFLGHLGTSQLAGLSSKKNNISIHPFINSFNP